MRTIVARCKYKTSSCTNTGFLHIIKEDEIEGIFTNDFARISIENNKLILHLTEDVYFFDDFEILRHKKMVSLYWTEYHYDHLYIPEEYTLKDEDGNVLYLFVECLISKKEEIDYVLNKLDTIKY